MRWLVPYHIAKYARPLPYFMKYAGNYYSRLNNLAKTRCNLNYLCWDIEKWQKTIRFNRKSPDTSRYMIDRDQEWNEDKYAEVEKVFLEFNKEIYEIQKQSKMKENYDDYKEYFSGYSKEEVQNTEINWEVVYSKYRDKLNLISNNMSELANYAVDLCYIKYPNKSKNFCWVVTEEGLIANLEKNRELNIKLPQETFDRNGIEYLGRYYEMGELFSV